MMVRPPGSSTSSRQRRLLQVAMSRRRHLRSCKNARRQQQARCLPPPRPSARCGSWCSAAWAQCRCRQILQYPSCPSPWVCVGMMRERGWRSSMLPAGCRCVAPPRPALNQAVLASLLCRPAGAGQQLCSLPVCGGPSLRCCCTASQHPSTGKPASCKELHRRARATPRGAACPPADAGAQGGQPGAAAHPGQGAAAQGAERGGGGHVGAAHALLQGGWRGASRAARRGRGRHGGWILSAEARQGNSWLTSVRHTALPGWLVECRLGGVCWRPVRISALAPFWQRAPLSPCGRRLAAPASSSRRGGCAPRRWAPRLWAAARCLR